MTAYFCPDFTSKTKHGLFKGGYGWLLSSSLCASALWLIFDWVYVDFLFAQV
jgi:hypothetical protein